MHKGFHKTSQQICEIAALFVLMFSSALAEGYQPMPGSFRPPSLGGAGTSQSGFRQDNNQQLSTPPQQQGWAPQPQGGTSGYYAPAPQLPAYQPPVQQAPAYPQQQIYYGSSLPLQYGYTMPQIQQPAATYPIQPIQPVQPPAYQPFIQQAPVYPQQQIYYGGSYTAPQIQQPAATQPSQPEQQPMPFTSRPYGGESSRFRPPELKGTD